MANEDDPALAALSDEFVDRLRAGEHPDVAEYARLHPDLAEDIRELFPVLAVMEGLKPPSGAPKRAGGAEMPERIGPYRVVRELGRGGMGRVFEARAGNDERVAVKIVHPHLVDRPGYLARFLREVETASRIEHPGVVRALGSGIAEERGVEVPYLALEFIEGQNLRELLAEVSPLSERLCRVIGARVAEALAAVHEEGVLHRDVKPENVVITNDESVKLMDLGVALIQEEKRRLTGTGEFVGSLMYAAPEQIRGGHVGPETDLYALGLVLFELLAGAHPADFDAGSRTAFLAARDGAPSLAAAAPGVSPFMDAVVGMLLATDPRKRPESAAFVSRVLREGEASEWWRTHEAEVGVRPRTEPAPIFGRSAEVERLDALLGAIADGAARACLVVGEPGIGKTHLVEAWLERTAEGAALPRVLEVQHLSTSAPHSTCPLGGALSTQVDDRTLEPVVLHAVGGDAGVAGAVVRHLRGHDTDGTQVSVPLVERSYVALLEHFAEGRGLIVVIEDLHDSTEERRASLLRIVRQAAELPVVFVATARGPLPTDFSAAWNRVPRAERLELGPLDAESGFRLVQSVAGARITGASGVRELVRRADGNPYFLIELARNLAARSTAAGEPGSDPHTPIPETLDALIEARLAALTTEQHDLIAAAACTGETFDPDVVAAGAEIPKLAGLRMLHALDREHQLVEPVGSQYRFRQKLVQEKLHDDLPPALRAAYHGAIGAVLEARCGDPCPPYAACEIAEHHLQGDDPRRALPYVRDAMEFLIAQDEPRRAAAMADQVLALELTDAERAHALYVRGDSLKLFAPLKEALPALEEARALAVEVGDDLLAMRAVAMILACQRGAGFIEPGLALAAQAADDVDRLGDARLAAVIHSSHAHLLRDLGRMEDARAAAQRGLDSPAVAGDAVAIGRLAWTLGGIEVELSNLAAARLLLDRSISIAKLHGDLDLETSCLNALAKVDWLECRMEPAIAQLERVLAVARERGDTRIETVTAANLAQSIPYSGDYAAAEAYAKHAEEIAHELGYYEIEAHALLSLGHIRCQRGRLGEALEALRAARALIGKMPTPAMEARLSVLIPNVLSWTGQFDEADAIIERGIEVARKSGSPRELHLIEWARGVMLEAQGRRAEALPILAEAARGIEGTGARQITAANDQRVAEVELLEGHEAEARERLDRAHAIAAPGGLHGVAALCRVWRELLPGGNLLTAHVELENHAEEIGAPARLRAFHALASRTGDEAFLGRARDEARALVDSMPQAARAGMIAAVPLYSELLGS